MLPDNHPVLRCLLRCVIVITDDQFETDFNITLSRRWSNNAWEHQSIQVADSSTFGYYRLSSIQLQHHPTRLSLSWIIHIEYLIWDNYIFWLPQVHNFFRVILNYINLKLWKRAITSNIVSIIFSVINNFMKFEILQNFSWNATTNILIAATINSYKSFRHFINIHGFTIFGQYLFSRKVFLAGVIKGL